MGFCRRCGEIVVGPRCKCGGTAVAPVVSWKQLNAREQSQDRWSKTYVSTDKSPTRPTNQTPSTDGSTSVASHATGSRPASPIKRFPRPISSSTINTIPISSRVAAYIATTTSDLARPSSPLKQSTTALYDSMPESGILPSPHTSTLAKVYGSVLQPKETLTMHSCAICDTPFLPDATIYPDPNELSGSNRFLCRPCFTTNGGSKGTCPACSRPVLTIKSEGSFVKTADNVWHKSCFRCNACFKSIGDTPMVDLLGKPSCVDCFDHCLKQDGNTPKKQWESPSGDKNVNGNLGGFRTGKSREGTPAMEELEQRLGIVRSREGSPTLEELSSRLSTTGRTPEHKPIPTRLAASPASPLCKTDLLRDDSSTLNPSQDSRQVTTRGINASPGSISPIRYSTTNSSPEDTAKSVKQRLSKSSAAPDPSLSLLQNATLNFPLTFSNQKPTPIAPKNTTPSRIPVATSTARSSPASLRRVSADSGSDNGSTKHRRRDVSQLPDLVSDHSETATQSSGPNSPPRGQEDVDVFGEEGMIKGHDRIRNAGTVEPPLHGYGQGDFFDDAKDSSTPVHSPRMKSATNTGSKSKSSKCALSSSDIDHSTSRFSVPMIPPSATCARCNSPLFNLHTNVMGGHFVTVPQDPRGTGKGVKSKTYHKECFRCTICDGTFKENENGKAVFVRGERGACHVECAKPKQIGAKSIPNLEAKPPADFRPLNLQTLPSQTSSGYQQPPLTAPPTSSSFSFPRFGGAASCPGCRRTVSPMERGVVPGPQGTRWHVACLVCGGKKEIPIGPSWRVKEDRKKGEPGCGKKLDSAAKSDGQGGIWCRECLLLLPAGMRSSPHGSPTRSALAPTATSNATARIAPQMTGVTTIARQFTGLGSGDALVRQLTGGGLSPTRQLGSPTKGLSDRSPSKQLPTIRERPRPKSVIGMRTIKSVDEGRGMYLVRQMTGGSGNWQ